MALPRRALLALAAVAVLPVASAGREPTVKDRRLAACYADMRRLCGGEPDKTKLRSCIRPKRALVSPTCRAWLDVPG